MAVQGGVKLLCWFGFVVCCVLSCSSDLDCQLNGRCVSGKCLCETAWTGESCSTLNLLPATVNAGYRDAQAASWGGTLVQQPDGYELFVAQMVNHCGLNQWETNSRIIRAKSTSPTGPFTQSDVLLAPFAHNPQLIRAPDGTWLLFHIGSGKPNGHVLNCTTKQVRSEYDPPEFSTFVESASSLDGPWTQTLLIPYVDNPSAYIFPNGTTIIMFRKYNGSSPNHYTDIGIAVAPHWKGPYKLKVPIFDNQMEDPFLWRSNSGSFHALFHDMTRAPYNYVGRHAYSQDGLNWNFSIEPAYNSTVHYTDGSYFTYARRERPQLHFQNGIPKYLTNGIQAVHGNDHTFTLIQPVAS